jgi:DNA repair protein RecN (Recombination protein N)
MLVQLNVKNFAIVDEAELEFSPGLNIITGETGAGKSILIKALTTLAGGRVNSDLIRHGADQASITGIFEVSEDHPALNRLGELGIEMDADDSRPQIILRRTISQKGRSSCYINDCPTSIQSMSQISGLLLDIFGQHENQRLLNPSEHHRYLDLFLVQRNVLKNYRESWSVVSDLFRQVNEFHRKNQARQRDRDYMEFRLKEFEDLQPTEDEFFHLEASVNRQTQMQNWRNAVSKSQRIIDEGASEESIARAMDYVMRELSHALEAHPQVAELVESAKSISSQLEDFSFSLNQVLSKLENEVEDSGNAQERLDAYYGLIHKTSSRTVTDLVGKWTELACEMKLITGADEHLTGLLVELKAAVKELESRAKALSKERRAASEKIQKSVQGELADLGIPDARFLVEFEPVLRPSADAAILNDLGSEFAEIAERLRKLSADGAESIQFLLGANKGEACLPLQKAASGGEISRIMLAIKKAMAVDAATCVMVFDEIDTGISGRVADRVGRKLSELAKLFQVLCISHLPQVAVYADVNLSVRKSAGAERTTSRIVKLSKSSEIVDEIATLLSGPELSASSRKNAKDLIAKAEENKSRI